MAENVTAVMATPGIDGFLQTWQLYPCINQNNCKEHRELGADGYILSKRQVTRENGTDNFGYQCRIATFDG